MKFEAAYLASVAAALSVTMAVAAPAAAQDTDWTQRVTVSAVGGHIIGNPLAKHALTEYVSYTCNHCASFEMQSHLPLKSDFIAKGHVNAEVRNYVRDPLDLTAAMLARCGGSSKFFGNHRALMSAQSSYLQAAQSASQATRESWYEGAIADRLKKIASDTGLYAILEKRGFTKAQMNVCLSNETEQRKIVAMTKFATDTLKISGTPSFTLNGKVVDNVHSWPALRPQLLALSDK